MQLMVVCVCVCVCIVFDRDALLNLLFVFPSFCFLLVYMILLAIWIEIVIFSRDHYIIERDTYRIMSRRIYSAVVGIVLCTLLSVCSLSQQPPTACVCAVTVQNSFNCIYLVNA